jgi:hypothetical protein
MKQEGIIDVDVESDISLIQLCIHILKQNMKEDNHKGLKNQATIAWFVEPRPEYHNKHYDKYHRY